MREEKITADRLAGVFRRGFRGDRDHHGTGLPGAGSAGVLGSLASVAYGISYVVSYLFVAIYLDKPPLPLAVRGSSDAGMRVPGSRRPL